MTIISPTAESILYPLFHIVMLNCNFRASGHQVGLQMALYRDYLTLLLHVDRPPPAAHLTLGRL